MPRRRVRAESRARYYIREEAEKRGWNTGHVATGGHFLEENEIVAHFADIGLGLDKPDFLLCLSNLPAVVVEAKNNSGQLDQAIAEAIEYAETINATGRYSVRIAVGAAGEQDKGFMVVARYLSDDGWVPLNFRGQEITTIPAPNEVELAIEANDGSTTVSVPDSSEFIDAAIELSSLLRTAKVEAPLRPKVIGSVVVGMYQGLIDTLPENALASVNALVIDAIDAARDISDAKKDQLKDALRLSGADFDRLAPYMGRVVNILRRLNVRSVLHTDTDFLGMFYEAFLRYGYDNNALGIVFTPRHITRFCVRLARVSPTDRVIDIASGTGGFLVAAFDMMMAAARSAAAIAHVKSSLYGFDTNPTVCALANLNMFFRGDGKSHISFGSCFDVENRDAVRQQFSRAFLNPPFSQEEEPEVDFIDAALAALQPEGILVAVVYAGVFADDDHKAWRENFLRNHTLLGMISLPEDLFYPTAAPTSIIIAQAHVPQDTDEKVFMGRVWNDGYTKLKGRRVECEGNQLDEMERVFHQFRDGEDVDSFIATLIDGGDLNEGAEWSPQQWLPQPEPTPEFTAKEQEAVLQSIYKAVAHLPDLADEVIDDFETNWEELPDLPLNTTGPITDFFDVVNAKSAGEKNYSDGGIPYISSGDSSNSIIRLIGEVDGEVFENGAITVTAFGTAALQPWPFMARGNGGSAVRVLVPRFSMTSKELVWFAAQINMQRWRFFYARMAIKGRLKRLVVKSPPVRLPDEGSSVAENVREFSSSLTGFSHVAPLG